MTEKIIQKKKFVEKISWCDWLISQRVYIYIERNLEIHIYTNYNRYKKETKPETNLKIKLIF